MSMSAALEAVRLFLERKSPSKKTWDSAKVVAKDSKSGREYRDVGGSVWSWSGSFYVNHGPTKRFTDLVKSGKYKAVELVEYKAQSAFLRRSLKKKRKWMARLSVLMQKAGKKAKLKDAEALFFHQMTPREAADVLINKQSEESAWPEAASLLGSIRHRMDERIERWMEQ